MRPGALFADDTGPALSDAFGRDGPGGDRFDMMTACLEMMSIDLITQRAGDMRRLARVISPNMDAITRAAVTGIAQAVGAQLAPYGMQIERAAAADEGPRVIRLYLKKAAQGAAER